MTGATGFPADYEEAVYAGVLGKIIGVYLGRPFEGWDHRRIVAELGPIDHYVHERVGEKLIVTDDDISGTFTFVRAMADHGHSWDLTPEQIGQSWLNYLIEGRTILWWSGLGNSTEHTAYLRLKSGVPAPLSGSAALNTTVVSEQIGAQIFIDSWAMLCPGDPARAADLARRAASVSHDGEAVYGAQVVAALEAGAFVEKDLDELLDRATALIPQDSVIYRLIADLRALRRIEPDWERARQFIEDVYGYDRYGGNCHMVPNHALIMLALLWGDDDFGKSLMIVNTSGWDTDCNSGNVGCILGIKNGLAGIDTRPDLREPVADQLFLPTAEPGGAITDAVLQTKAIVDMAHRLRWSVPTARQGDALESFTPPDRQAERGSIPTAPKGGARFSFHLPGSVQAFRPAGGTPGSLSVGNASLPGGDRALALRFRDLGANQTGRAATPTFIPPDFVGRAAGHYELLASPTLHSGQEVAARVLADGANGGPVRVALYLSHYDGDDCLVCVDGRPVTLAPGAEARVTWRVPDTGGQPIAEIGLAVASGDDGPAAGTVYLDWLTWQGEPHVYLVRPADGGTMWRRAWVDAVDHVEWHRREAFRVMQDHGAGLFMQGGGDWRDYSVEALVVPHAAAAAGLAARVQGLKRFYSLELGADQVVRLVRSLERGRTVLAERPFPFAWDAELVFQLEVAGPRLRAWIDGGPLFDLEDAGTPLRHGAVGIVVEEGRVSGEWVEVRPLTQANLGASPSAAADLAP